MRRFAWIFLFAFFARLLLGAGAVLCVQTDGVANLEWVGATCCAEECLLQHADHERAGVSSRSCDCQDESLTPPLTVKPATAGVTVPPLAPTLALTSIALAPRLDGGESLPRLDVELGRPRSVAPTILRF